MSSLPPIEHDLSEYPYFIQELSSEKQQRNWQRLYDALYDALEAAGWDGNAIPLVISDN
jgi:hypothetical protein